VEILVDNVAPKRGFLRTLPFPPLIVVPMLYTYLLISRRRCMKLAIDSAFS